MGWWVVAHFMGKHNLLVKIPSPSQRLEAMVIRTGNAYEELSAFYRKLQYLRNL